MANLDKSKLSSKSSSKSSSRSKSVSQKSGSTDDDSNEEEFKDNFNIKIDLIKQQLKENYQQQKKLMNDMNELIKANKNVRLSSKPGEREYSTRLSDFNKPEPVPKSLKKLLNIDGLQPRSKITGLLYQYFTEHKMYNPTTKKEIIPNAEIKKIFKMKSYEIINFYNLQTWIKKVYEDEDTIVPHESKIVPHDNEDKINPRDNEDKINLRDNEDKINPRDNENKINPRDNEDKIDPRDIEFID